MVGLETAQYKWSQINELKDIILYNIATLNALEGEVKDKAVSNLQKMYKILMDNHIPEEV